jgi:hypothetical protein
MGRRRAGGELFAEVRDLMLAWLPQAEDVVLAGADHSLALTCIWRRAPAVASSTETSSGQLRSRRIEGR